MSINKYLTWVNYEFYKSACYRCKDFQGSGYKGRGMIEVECNASFCHESIWPKQ